MLFRCRDASRRLLFAAEAIRLVTNLLGTGGVSANLRYKDTRWSGGRNVAVVPDRRGA